MQFLELRVLTDSTPLEVITTFRSLYASRAPITEPSSGCYVVEIDEGAELCAAVDTAGNLDAFARVFGSGPTVFVWWDMLRNEHLYKSTKRIYEVTIEYFCAHRTYGVLAHNPGVGYIVVADQSGIRVDGDIFGEPYYANRRYSCDYVECKLPPIWGDLI